MQAVEQLILEPNWLYKPEAMQVAGRFALCHRVNVDGAKLQQELYDVTKLEWVLGQIRKMPDRDRQHWWISQATLAPGAVNRRISSIVLLNAVWVDIDLAHPPEGFAAGTLPRGDYSNAEHLAVLLEMHMVDAGLPVPTVTIGTGGGLCSKWIFTEATSVKARARWQSLQREIVKRVASLGDNGDRWPASLGDLSELGDVGDSNSRWPVDKNACDASRILRLVGSHNPRWDARCRILRESGKTYDFEYLCSEILPYSRQDVQEFRVAMRQGEDWTRNRVIAAAAGIGRARTIPPANAAADVKAQISDESARGLWVGRFEFARAVMDARNGARKHSRNNHFWPMANALAHSCSTADQLKHELAALHQDYFRTDGWTRAEAMESAASVLRQFKKRDPYKMRTVTFCEKMGITPGEYAEHSHLLGESKHNAKRAAWNAGAMGFKKMQGLSANEFIAETKRRMAAAALRSTEVRKGKYDIDLHEKARLMSSSGSSMRAIGRELGVNDKTVSSWLKSERS